MLTRYIVVVALISASLSFAQSGAPPGGASGAGGSGGAGAGSSAGGAGAASSGAGSGSPTLESQIMAYAALDRIAAKVSESINHQADSGKHVLIGTQTNMSQVGAFLTFVNGTRTLVAAYNSKIPPPPRPVGGIEEHDFLAGAFGGAAFGPSVTAVTALLSALKAQTTTTNSTFTTTDQAFIADIESHVDSKSRIVTIAFPSDLDTGSRAIATYLADVYNARSATAQYLIMKHPPKNKDDKPYDPSTDLKDLDTQLTALLASLAPLSGSTTSDVVLGGGLLAALKAISGKEYRLDDTATYLVLTFYSDAAGGGTRINQPFLISFFAPWPYPSYNGGAVVSFSLRNQKGAFVAANTYYDIDGYSKWKAAKSSKCGYSNLGVESQKKCENKQAKKATSAGGS